MYIVYSKTNKIKFTLNSNYNKVEAHLFYFFKESSDRVFIFYWNNI
jgi:hypothetical protein